MSMTKTTPSYESISDVKKFFYDIEDEEGGTTKHMGRLKRNAVVVTSAYGDKVAFMKTNRSKLIRDSRCQKVKARDSWGNTVERLRPTMLTEADCRAELVRLLESESDADDCIRKLKY
jgi:hypothetical protein